MSLNQSENITNIMQQLNNLKKICNELEKNINYINNKINNKNNILTYYRGFIVTEETFNINKMKIDNFYENLYNDKQKNVYDDNEKDKTIFERFKDVPSEYIFAILDTLIKNNDIYKICKKNMYEIKDNNIVEKNIIDFTNNMFILGMKRLLENVSGNDPQDRIYHINIIYKFLIKYEYIIKSDVFGIYYKKFYATVLEKCIELSLESGEICSWLTFAQFCPEMITPDCYLYINYNSEYYVLNDKNLINTYQNYEKYKDYIVIDKHKYDYNYDDNHGDNHDDYDCDDYNNNSNNSNYKYYNYNCDDCDYCYECEYIDIVD